ncbi:MAG: MBL fold metallo-hydrolase [Ruminococcaceae bacterium]|nr:MBL fold metallo-hydrolase [Oscillospiraceae bacterium]
MVITVPVKGYFEENTFFWIDDETGRGYLIDPGWEEDRLLRMIRYNGWTIEKILLTHGHFDHMGAADGIRKTLHIPILAHSRCSDYLESPKWNLSVFCGEPIVLKDVQTVEDGDLIESDSFPDAAFRVIYTPGHTTDSVCFYCERDGLCFTGDTIFRGAIGNDRFPGGDRRQMIRSICGKILTLPDETKLYSGHTGETDVRTEKPGFAPYGGFLTADP